MKDSNVKIKPRSPKREYRNHRALKIMAIILVIIMIPLVPTLIYFYDKEDASLPVVEWSYSDAFDMGAYVSLTAEDDSFTVLQLTDLHFTFGGWPGDVDTYALMDAMFEQTSPDLVVFTGDLCFTLFNSRMFEMFVKYMNTHPDIYWTYTFGNHDGWGRATKRKIADILLNAGDNCLFTTGPTELGDIELMLGNYPVYVKDSQGNVKLNLIHLDTGTGDIRGYGYISPAQVEWYKWLIEGTSDSVGYNVPSLVYYHIPVPQYAEAYDNPIISGVQNGKICVQRKDMGFYDSMVAMGSTVATFCGHDHLNDFEYMTSDNILLCYGRVSGMLAFTARPALRGARVTTIDLNQQITADYIAQASYQVVLDGNTVRAAY